MEKTENNPLQPFLETYGLLVLDGGLATELEARGHDLSDELWSARLLIDDPEAIRRVHLDYLEAGADCIISASYQGTVAGFMRWGMSQRQAEDLLRLSVQLAIEARDAFWAEPAHRIGRLRPIVAASVGPYGAALADGSEYTGAYDLGEEQLVEFHRQRWHLLADTGTDILACETIPSQPESRALAKLLQETPGRFAWFSFSCRDGQHISDGARLADCLAPLGRLEQVVAVGVNCTPPRFIPELIVEARSATSKPILVYPNSGEQYDVVHKRWLGLSDSGHFASESVQWCSAGARLVGGCCRTGPEHIRQIRTRLIAGDWGSAKAKRP